MAHADCAAGYLRLLPIDLHNKLACYLLGGGWHRDDTRRNHYHFLLEHMYSPINTLAAVEWLSPGYTCPNPSGKRKRRITAIQCVSSTTEEANKRIKEMDDLERKREEKRQSKGTMKLL